MHIEVVLFDLGGVLIELGGMGDMAHFATEDDEDEIWRRWLTCPWVRRFERGGCEATSFAQGMVESWSMPVSPEAFLEAFASWPKGLLPGARELVRAVGAERRVSCLSNSNSIHTERGWAEFGLYEHFDGLYFSHEIGLIKPDRNVFDHVIQDLGCSAEQVLFLDDNQINVDAAREAGLVAERVVGVSEAQAILEEREILG